MLDLFWIFIFGLIGIPAIVGIVGALHTNVHVDKFTSLGDIRGKPIQSIIETVGQPIAVSATPDGPLYQWQGVSGASGYHYAILVDHDGNAIGFTHSSVM